MKAISLNGGGREERDSTTIQDVIQDGIEITSSEEDNDEINTIASTILGVITVVGMVMAVLILAILGVKYMMGSVEQKAEYKKDLVPYAIGAMLLFGISTVIGFLQEIAEILN